MQRFKITYAENLLSDLSLSISHHNLYGRSQLRLPYMRTVREEQGQLERRTNRENEDTLTV